MGRAHAATVRRLRITLFSEHLRLARRVGGDFCICHLVHCDLHVTAARVAWQRLAVSRYKRMHMRRARPNAVLV